MKRKLFFIEIKCVFLCICLCIPVLFCGCFTDVSYEGDLEHGEQEPYGTNSSYVWIDSYPAKVRYRVGDALDTSGLVLKCYGSDGKETVFTSYKLELRDVVVTDGFIFKKSHIGDAYIYVYNSINDSYLGYFTISVKKSYSFAYSSEGGVSTITGFVGNEEEPVITGEDEEKICPEVYSTPSDFRYTINNDDSITIMGLSTAKASVVTNLTIPESIDGHLVKDIYYHAFHGYNFVEVEVPESVKFPDYYDFPFSNCKNLKKITVGNVNNSNICYGCPALETICINGSSEEIHVVMKKNTNYAGGFSNCQGIRNIIIEGSPNKVEINSETPLPLLERLVLPESIKNLRIEINGNSTLEELHIGSIEKIYLKCKNFTALKKISFTSGDIYCNFGGCLELDEVDCGEANINGACFNDCIKLSEIKLGSGAFLPSDGLKNTSLEEVVFRNKNDISYRKLESHYSNGILEGCEKLKKVVFDNCCVPPYLFGRNGRSEPVDLILDNATAFDSYAFYNCDFLTEFSYTAKSNNDPLRKFGAYVFAECDNLRNVEIHKCTNSNFNQYEEEMFFDAGTFYNCRNLESVVTDYPIKTWSEYLFYNCKSLKNIKLKKGKIGIYSYAFYGCENLLPDVGLDINEYDFSSVYNTKDTFTNSAFYADKYIVDSSAFSAGFFSGLNVKNLEFQSDLYYLPKEFCQNNTFLQTVVLDGDINFRTFKGCSSLRTVKLGDSKVHSVCPDSFDDCTSLQSIIVPSKYYNQYQSSSMWTPYRNKIVRGD